MALCLPENIWEALCFKSLLPDLANPLSASMFRVASQVLSLASTFVTEQDEVFAGKRGAVAELRGCTATGFTFADGFRLVGEVDVHAVVEDV